MVHARVSFAIVAFSVTAALAVACAAPVPSNRSLVVECEEGEACDAEGQRSNARSGASSSSSSSGGAGPRMPDTVLEDAAVPAPAADAGAPSSSSSSSSSGGTSTRGPSCTALATCCEKIERAGFTGSARQCRSVVTSNNEYACAVTKKDYAQPIDQYDAICP
jgi:hypothetical protein